jgi:RHH-type proline utilization regulon transcriptional repressor/proline dehydrogenase/delta 1-pyrroline-5-carboxylate dehydrogenase
VVFTQLTNASTEVGERINSLYLADEAELMRSLYADAACPANVHDQINSTATRLVQAVRRDRAGKSGLDALLLEYDLSSREGVVLMCLAEALLRIPDPETMDLLIADRLAAGDWEQHMGASDSLFVNASTWGLMLTGRVVQPDAETIKSPGRWLRGVVSRLGEPMVRAAMRQAMRIMGEQFVMGRSIAEAIERSRRGSHSAYLFAFDMLGEAAITNADAERYCEAYLDAIRTVGSQPGQPEQSAHQRASISVKLSALCPRFEFAQLHRALADLVPRLTTLVSAARECGVPITVDAEESDRLEATLEVFRQVLCVHASGDWGSLGIAVQAYQRRATAVIDWLIDLSERHAVRIPVRLVKGAYWDAEIKISQERGWPTYPVFTRKVNTDVSYLACAQRLLSHPARFFPQFATHNAHTVAWVLHNAGHSEYEFQRLHGMGEELYEQVIDARPCRVYAPVGRHEDLLPYLVRRLLENGSNTSFVNRIVQEDAPIAELVAEPTELAARLKDVENPRIPPPPMLFGAGRRNSAGVNFCDGRELALLGQQMTAALERSWQTGPRINASVEIGSPRPSLSPADRRVKVGTVEFAEPAQVDRALDAAANAFPRWNATPVAERASVLRRAADLFERERASLMALCVSEAGKCLPDALAEVREAVDFLRYYAAEAERLMSSPIVMPGPTGERNELQLAGRGIFVCISPWNFPLAIFTGQIAAALAVGNTVLAKPAEQTGLIGGFAVELLTAAGLPPGALQFLPGEGGLIGARAVADPRVAGVAFTGSTETAWRINRTLAARDAPIAALIAETGGQNAMIVDSTALAEQVVTDVVQSAFNSAGQRCSALRVLFLQEEIADRVLELLAGHMRELNIGDPAQLETDIGPVIDKDALEALRQHRVEIARLGRVVFECPLEPATSHGSFMGPVLVEIPDISVLKEEVFGPILHTVRFQRDHLEQVLQGITNTGFGLTFGIQSRIEQRVEALAARLPVGNIYANRNMIGAVVGVQPFGGCGLSGTGPKVGGPHYLLRFAAERALSVNTAAVGGNASLLSLMTD